MIEYRCTECHLVKEERLFSVDNSCKSGRRSQCKECRNAYHRSQQAKERKVMRRLVGRQSEASRALIARELNGTVQTYWHIAEPNRFFGVAMIGGGYV